MNALAIARFELVRRARTLSTYVYFVTFLAAGAFFTVAAGGGMPGANVSFGSSKVFINAPYALNQTITALGYLGVLVTAAMMGRAVQQDFEHETFHFFFTSPVSSRQYLAGRFLGAAITLTAIFSSIALGCFAGVHFPTVDQELVGPGRLAAYVHPYLVSVIPNLVATGAIFFALGALGRRMMPVYVSAVVMLVGYLIAGSLMKDLDNKWWAALLDPWGNRAQHFTTEYWPIADRNTRLVPLEGYFLWNRVLWLGVGAAALGLAMARFRFAQPAASARKTTAPEAEPAAAPLSPGTSPRVEADASGWAYLRMLPRLSWLAFRETVKNVYFAVIALAGMLFMFVSARALGSLFGTNTYPVAYQVLELTTGTFALFMIIVATFSSGELVWRERDARMDQIHDALPIPSWLPLSMKLLALVGAQALLTAIILVSSVLIQAFKGYFHFELGLQIHYLFTVFLPDMALACVLAVAVQVLVNQKYVGHFIVVLYWLATVFASQLGFEDRLYQFGQSPQVTYSDMNGYGPFLAGLRWFNLYWAVAALAVAVTCHLFWVRGVDPSWRMRVVGARRRFTPGSRLWLGASAAAFVAAGAVIFYNTHLLNPFRTESDEQQARARYEQRYRSHLDDPQPKILDVKVAVDLYPADRRAELRGTYRLQNKTDRDVSAVLLNLPWDITIHELALDRPHALESVKEDGFHTAKLQSPLKPGEEATLRFSLSYGERGFRHGEMTAVVENGTFINSELLPHLGYRRDRELVEDKDRRKFGLAPRERMLDRDDPRGLQRNALNPEADFVGFEATVSTVPDQIALAPGYLQREWQEGGRRYFEYKMDAPILDFFSFLSARYQVKRDRWNDVAIEVYFHPGHAFNVDRMVDGVKASLSHYTRAYGPYQHRQVRILEFPRYAQFAQSFPNTIPFAESIGFIAKVDPDDPEDVDYPFFVTAHEVAHQWWAHQVIGGDVQGAEMLAETLSEYSALMVMKEKYGPQRMRKFLKYELHGYLQGRAFERKKELPLSRVEGQPYIRYNKGGMVMYALADLIGEDQVNAALRAFLERNKLKGPPYPSSTELLADLRKVTPPDLQYVIDDWFERITLYENRATKASYRKREDGKYEVTLKVVARKVQADELGAEKEQPLQDVIEIGALDDKDLPIALERRRFDKSGENELTLVVDRAPARAGIDPMNKLVDRNVEDNTVRAEAL
ncbi:MAG TPA: M1 family aminopeptidase [Myxococcales bacterium]|nr:M1 family aminopeptidase [Myxococcales bacterium]